MDIREHRHLTPSCAPPGMAEMDSWIVHGDLPEFIELRSWVMSNAEVRDDLSKLVSSRLSQLSVDDEMEGISSYKLWEIILQKLPSLPAKLQPKP